MCKPIGERILLPQEVANMLGVTLNTLNEYSKKPGFPKLVKRSPEPGGYYQHELKAYLDSFVSAEVKK
jgi:predicted DNA-binding transcriptional regulator AlpA